MVLIFIDMFEFFLAIANMCFSKAYNTKFLGSGYHPSSSVLWSTAFLLKRFEMPWVVSLLPIMECFAGNTKVAAGLADILARCTIVHPPKPFAGFGGQYWYGGNRIKTFGIRR